MQRTGLVSAALLITAAWCAPALAQIPDPPTDPHVVTIGTPLPAQWQRIDTRMWYRVGLPSAAMQWRRVDAHRWTSLPEGDPSL